VIDGRLLTEPVPETYASGKQAHVPLLAGWNRDEGSFVAMHPVTAEGFKSYVSALFQDRAPEFLKLYPRHRCAGASLRHRLRRRRLHRLRHMEVDRSAHAIRRLARLSYLLELAAPVSKYHLESFAFHSDDIEYVFGTLDTRPGALWRPEDRKLSEQMMSYWTNFAKPATPTDPACPRGLATAKTTCSFIWTAPLLLVLTPSARATSSCSRACRRSGSEQEMVFPPRSFGFSTETEFNLTIHPESGINMTREPVPGEKPFIGLDRRLSMTRFPLDVQRSIGFALSAAQYGGKHPSTKRGRAKDQEFSRS